MKPDRERWSARLGRLLARLAKKLQTPALATVPVSAAMLSRVDTLSPDQTLADAAQLVARNRCAVPVVDHGRPLGVVTRDALASALAAGGPRAPVASAERRGVITVDPSTPADEVLAQLRSMPDAIALVVDHGSPVGLLTAEQLEDYLTSLRAA